ncbi:sulfotransferase family protein [Mameliella sediminis]|uniref:sulfotransferase family protein n=1 Tax=Mameliella sediminis TaxID=2836866 RepID=UPI001C47F561|nr:sulfotransferase family protein [Mameliella sediminis]MBV7393372.1 sulfotransferase family protein [Mameliella sediminis]
MTKTFFLGLGGQKCGSTWIQAYLARQPGSDFGRLGEYQTWEHHLGGVFARYRAAEPSLLGKLRARAKTTFGALEPAAHLRWRLQKDPNQYFDYFAGLLSRDGITRTGDITPSYAELPAERLQSIIDGFRTRGITVKLLFSMRDPVDRLRSQLRMEMEKGRLPESPDNDGPMRAFYATTEAEARSRYDRTLNRIEAVFAPQDVFLTPFETLFTADGIAGLSRFANVPVDAQAGMRAVNSRAKGSGLSEELESEIARHYAPVYEATAHRLPQVREAWPSARFVWPTAA